MRSRINTFFIEIIIVILFFFVSITVILQLFAAAHNKSLLNTASNVAMVKIQRVTENIKKECTADLEGEFLKSFFIEARESDAVTAYQYFTSDWERSGEASTYKLVLKLEARKTPAGTIIYSEIDVYEISNKNEPDKLICDLDSQNYLPEQGAAERSQ